MIGCSTIQNPWFCKSIINRRVMGKQTCSANKRVTFIVIVERVNSLCQLLNLLDGEALYKVSIGLVTGAFFARHDLLFSGYEWRGCQSTKIGALIRKLYVRRWKKTKKIFLFSCVYIYITSCIRNIY